MSGRNGTERHYYRVVQAVLTDGKLVYAGDVIREDSLGNVRREIAKLLKGRTDLHFVVWKVSERVVDQLGFLAYGQETDSGDGRDGHQKGAR